MLRLAAALCVAALVTAPVSPRDSAVTCPHISSRQATGDPSLYCLDLVPVPDLGQVSGAVELAPARSPFGVAVSVDGHHVYELTFTLAGLPDPASLGPYTTYVAWATTPELEPVLRLGEVRSGRTAAGRVAFNKFLVLVTAERGADGGNVGGWRGKTVLRGTSPSNMMQPHGIRMLPAQPVGHLHEVRPSGWLMPQSHPGVPTMIPGLEPLEPDVRPFLARPEPASLPAARPRRLVELKDGDTLRLAAVPVRRTIAGRALTGYGFNGQYPGPFIRVPQLAIIVVDFTNGLDQPTSVHWHGVRLDNSSDGVPGVTQEAVPPGGAFRYRVRFPDAGIYWYHPHVREDVQQDLGLFGNLLVRSPRADYFGPANREEVLMLDDLLLAGSGPVPYGAEAASHALMGRFGNVFLVNGEPDYRLSVRPGEVVRFFLTNASNVRTYNLSLAGARLKLVGSDVGKFERERWVENVVIAPAERYIVEARFERAGVFALENRVQAIDHVQGVFFSEVDTLGLVSVSGARGRPAPDYGRSFERLRLNRDVIRDIDPFRPHFDRPVDHTVLLTLRVKHLPFGLVQVLRLDTAYVNPVEWSGTMPMMDWLSTGRDVEWVVRDLATGRENMDIDWRFRRGDVVKLRLVNDRHTLHAMQHPVHVHGQRFLVLATNGMANDDLVWKDTVLVPAGSAVDVLLELSNPGRWMLHCHVAEHLEAGMHMVFTVE